MSPLSWATLGLAMAFAGSRNFSAVEIIVGTLGYTAVLYAANVLHSVGHVISGWLVGAPVEIIIMTSTRDVIIYAQPGGAAPARRRLGRALGGPAANLAVGIAPMLTGHGVQARWHFTAGLVNVCVAAWTLMPVPTLDGRVIWRILIHLEHDTT